MKINYKLWLNLSVLNLTMVAALGMLMRYKIGFEFPYFEQKFLQHGHSHFAFAAWISQTLYVLMIHFMQSGNTKPISGHYNKLLVANTVCAWGMLLAFIIQGYGPLSIALSTCSIFISWVFAYVYLKDLKYIPNTHPSLPYFKAAHVFNIVSSIGTFVLAYMMATNQVNQKAYLGSVYYYLHFQYNGWFFFACAGLLIGMLHKLVPSIQFSNHTFRLFAWSCIPAYLLSTLWLNFPIWLNTLIAFAAVAQLIGWMTLIKPLISAFKALKHKIPNYAFVLFGLSGLSLSIKLLLQLASCIPYVSQLAFGFRPIVIAYLHLVLLAIFTLFILSYIHVFLQQNHSKLNRYALFTLIFGIFINEAILGIQGISSFSYTLLPYVNEALFAIAVMMFGALLALAFSLKSINYRNATHSDSL